jgi:large subunit ribosomal protein L15
MSLADLTKITDKSKKRVGRGAGSGKAKTAGRGTKGQKARGKTRAGFEGGQLPLIKRLPFRRGLGNTSHKQKPLAVNAQRLAILPANTVVTPEVLKQHGLVPVMYTGTVKVIGLTGDEKLTFEGVQLTRVAAERLKG